MGKVDAKEFEDWCKQFSKWYNGMLSFAGYDDFIEILPEKENESKTVPE